MYKKYANLAVGFKIDFDTGLVRRKRERKDEDKQGNIHRDRKSKRESEARTRGTPTWQ